MIHEMSTLNLLICLANRRARRRRWDEYDAPRIIKANEDRMIREAERELERRGYRVKAKERK